MRCSGERLRGQRQFGFTASYLKRLCHRGTGLSPKTYGEARRAERLRAE